MLEEQPTKLETSLYYWKTDHIAAAYAKVKDALIIGNYLFSTTIDHRVKFSFKIHSRSLPHPLESDEFSLSSSPENFLIVGEASEQSHRRLVFLRNEEETDRVQCSAEVEILLNHLASQVIKPRQHVVIEVDYHLYYCSFTYFHNPWSIKG